MSALWHACCLASMLLLLDAPASCAALPTAMATRGFGLGMCLPGTDSYFEQLQLCSSSAHISTAQPAAEGLLSCRVEIDLQAADCDAMACRPARISATSTGMLVKGWHGCDLPRQEEHGTVSTAWHGVPH